MNRGVVVLGATVLGLAGLLAFDQHQFGDPFALSSKSSGLKLPTSNGVAATAAASTESGSTQQAAPAKVQRAVGDSVPNQYGNVQVKVTVQDGKLTRVTFLDLPYGDPTSQSISDQVAPVLAQQSIDAQSANIAGISGATYTSDAYRQSLQSALDKAGFGQQ
jgi:uncharacterized protein with FMN-binding domain